MDTRTEKCILKDHKGASCDYLSKFRTARVAGKSNVPEQLVLTGVPEKFHDVPETLSKNIAEILKVDSHIKLRWLGDAACSKYVWQHFNDTGLGEHYDNEPIGAFRGDICRAAVLFREGGYYLDMDIQLRTPLSKLIDVETDFMTAFSAGNGRARGKHIGSMLNAVMAAEPNSPVLASTLFEINAWYAGDPSIPWGHLGGEAQMGTVTLWRGLNRAMECMCKRSSNLDLLWIRSERQESRLQWPCGRSNIRLYIERPIRMCGSSLLKDGVTVSEDCPAERANNRFDGVKYGLYDPSPEGKLVAWPRQSWCDSPGCLTGGHIRIGSKSSTKLDQLAALEAKKHYWEHYWEAVSNQR